MTPDERSPILDGSGQPARQAINTSCPTCGASAEKRVPSCGFGVRRPCCGVCGYVWQHEEFKD